MMRLSPSLRKYIGCFLWLVFTLGITPVSWLHDAVSHHKDVCYHQFNKRGKNITKADVNCHTLTLVAEAQFIHLHSAFIIKAPEAAPTPCFAFHAIPFYYQYYPYHSLRGPPFSFPLLKA